MLSSSPKLTPSLEMKDPKHILINISEPGLSALLPHSITQLIEHGLAHLRRVYPSGTRIGSSNMDPLVFWRNGSQVASLNWQNFDRGMQINEAMFVGSKGWVLKPAKLLGLGEGMNAKLKFSGEIIGVSSCEYIDHVCYSLVGWISMNLFKCGTLRSLRVIRHTSGRSSSMKRNNKIGARRVSNAKTYLLNPELTLCGMLDLRGNMNQMSWHFSGK
jgi:hypothetical protein